MRNTDTVSFPDLRGHGRPIVDVVEQIMKHKWGTVVQERPKKPEVLVSFNKDDKIVYNMLSRWFRVSEKEFERMVKEKVDDSI